jgi:multidrug efflux pump subunit AcrB
MFKNKRAKKPQQSRIAQLTLFLYNHVFISAAFWISLFVFGLLSYTVFMQRQGFPAVNVPISVVNALYLVDDKAVVDEKLSQPIVAAIDDVEGVTGTTATATENQITVVVEFDESLTSAEGSARVEKRLGEVEAELPKQAQVSFQAIDATRFNNKYDVLVAVHSDKLNVQERSEDAAKIAEQLRAGVPEAVNVEVVEQVKTGTNPVTGETVEEQVSFDWFGEKYYDGIEVRESTVIGITAKDGEDIIAFEKSVNDTLEEIYVADTFPDVRVNNAAGFAPTIQQQVSSLQTNLFEGLLIVVLVSLVFIGVRAGALAAVGMLVTLTATIGILFVSGITLNTISLFGLVLCLGLIVDDTIIMIEAIDRQRRAKKPLPEAIKVATKKVALASAAGTFTTMLGFAPLLFIGGILGEFIRILPITIIVSLAMSLIISLFFIPFMSRWFLSSTPKTARKSNPFGVVRRGADMLASGISRLILRANTRKRKIGYGLTAVAISLVFIVATGPVFSKLKFDIFPTAKDADTLSVEYNFVPGLTLDQAKDITAKTNDIIVEQAGSDLEKITYLGQAGNRSAQANLTLVSFKERERTAAQIAEAIEGAVTTEGARIVVNQQSAGPPKEEFPFKVQIDATNPAQAEATAQKLVAFLNGREVTRDNGTTAKVSEVNYNGERATITRLNGERTVQVNAGFDASDTSALVQSAQRLVQNEFITNADNMNGLDASAIAFDFGSESDNQESFESVLIALPILVILMFVLLAVQFKSFFQPLLILIAVPFSFFGVAVALLLSNNPLSFFVMVAFFALIGISVNNSILLTDYANQARRRGLSPRQAMAEAVTERTRPLLTTSLTSILALVPLALSDPFWESLAITLIGGLTASAILVLISFPYYYLALEAIRSRASLRWSRRKQTK